MALPADVESEIANAVAAGYQVTTHASSINFAGVNTVGYIIEDPATGSAAYKISSGENGGVVLIALAVVLLLLALLVASPVIAILLIVVALLFAGCGLSWYFGDDRWFDVYALIAIGLLGAFLAEAVAAAWWLVWGIPTAIELDLIIGNFDDVCASGGGP
jgi:hypothetical protein